MYASGIQMLGQVRRAEFITLTGLTRESFDARARRKQFPFTHTDVVNPGNAEDDDVTYQPYRVWDAYLTLIADDLNRTFGIHLSVTCQLARNMSMDLERRWTKIVDTSLSDQLAGGPKAILCGGVAVVFKEDWQRQQLPTWKPVVGTLPEIARQVGKTSINRVALTSATQLATVLRVRAANASVNLSAFWKT
jgi:hypothetical protein